MREPAWAGTCGFVWGLNASDLNDDSRALPETVEDQLAAAFFNLGAILDAQALNWANVPVVRVNLTQFERFEKRVNGALARLLEDRAGTPQLSVVGVEHLPRDALVALDVVLAR